jgi:hypothetical protein
MVDYRLLYGAVALFAGVGLLTWAAPLSSVTAAPLRTVAALGGGLLFVWGGSTMVRWASL